MSEQENNVVALVEPQGNSLTQRMAYAKALSSASLLPADYRGQAANILMALEYGHELGIGTMTAIQQIHVIKGKPTASAQLIGSLVRKAGHRLRVTGDENGAVATIVRKDDPDYEFKSVWNATRARAAGLLPAKPDSGWDKYPGALFIARAITDVARQACAEVLAGVAYTAEELGEVVESQQAFTPNTADIVEDLPSRTVPIGTPPQSGWSSRIGIGAVMAAQAATKEEMPIETSPILDAEEVDDWGIAKVKTEGWGTESFEAAEQFVTESSGETCEHGARSKVTGTKQETGNPWMRWDCPAGFKACGVVWYHIDKTTGEWVK